MIASLPPPPVLALAIQITSPSTTRSAALVNSTPEALPPGLPSRNTVASPKSKASPSSFRSSSSSRMSSEVSVIQTRPSGVMSTPTLFVSSGPPVVSS